MADDIDTLRRAATARGFTEDDDGFARSSPDGSERAVVRVAGGAYEARVFRHPTGPTPGPDPEPANGPQVFESADEALDYAAANLGADGT
jgi:hypothetical protein